MSHNRARRRLGFAQENTTVRQTLRLQASANRVTAPSPDCSGGNETEAKPEGISQIALPIKLIIIEIKRMDLENR